MQLLALYLGSATALILAVVLMHDTSPFALMGGAQYEWRARRRLLGKILCAVGAVCFTVALAGQVLLHLSAPPAPGMP